MFEEISEYVITYAEDLLDFALGLPFGTKAVVKWFIDGDYCVNEDCDCDDAECPKVSIDDDEIGCECCCDI